MVCTVCRKEIHSTTITKISSEILCGDCANNLNNRIDHDIAYDEMLEIIEKLRVGG